MESPRFYCPQIAAGVITLSESEARHALQSLRLRGGERVVLFDGQGHHAQGTLRPAAPAAGDRKAARAGKRTPTAAVEVHEVTSVPRPERRLSLIVAGCKVARLDWLTEKCTELGVGRLVLAEFERSVVHAGPQRVAKLRRIAIEACKQCGRAWLPEIETGARLADAVAGLAGSDLLVAHLADDATPLGVWLARKSALVHDLAVVVGPEGGLSPGEVEFLRSAGGKSVRLGEHTLRVETAAIAVAAGWAAAEAEAAGTGP